ncbi:MAG: glycogen debranching N-terminal domain-containing protein [Candidatus Binataceae bacterium]
MPAKINIGPPLLTISHGSTFMVTDLNGEISADSEQGLFAQDTRFVSYYAIFANGVSWTRLTSSRVTYYGARIYLINMPFTTLDGDVPAGTLSLVISRSASEGIHEDLDLSNHGLMPVRLNLEVALRSDFADLFEVKSHQFVRRGRIQTKWDSKRHELRTRYTHKDFRRTFTYRMQPQSPPGYANGRLTFEIALKPGAAWHSCCEFSLGCDGHISAPSRACLFASHPTKFDALHKEWMSEATKLTSTNEDVYRLYRQSVEDMCALRLHDQDMAHDVWVPAAGVPWFVTLFGRDSLIASLQNMTVNPDLARGALKKLAEFQATKSEDYRDADPGKIMHEIRFGELAHFHSVPHTPYYGSADATPLYLILLHENWKWTGDDGLVREYRDVALRCLKWIDRYGDLDGDGFQEYQSRSSHGTENMSWKDAGDAIVYPDGSQVKAPKALCELQGYVFDAWMRMAELFDHLGEIARASELRRKAANLRRKFEQRFWCDDIGFYALALDPDKHPVRTIASNPGHLLWSGIVTPEHAARVVKRLMQSDMWSGWGIRTLSADNPAYNPFSYQRGAVWPHDNGIIALGFKRYGFAAEAARIARDISEAASYFVSYQLPELYAGIEHQAGTFPVQYPGANVPQAWAAGSVFHLLRAILGLQADAPNGRLYVDPALPKWLPQLTLHGLAVGKARVDLRFSLEGETTNWEATVQQGTLQIEKKPWAPYSPTSPFHENGSNHAKGNNSMVQIKRAYEAPSRTDGTRILVDRLWPRGLNKEKVNVAKWMKELGPSTELRKSFGHDPAHWKEFRTRYKAELKRPEAREMLKEISKTASRGTVTLVYSAKDEEHNQAVVISEVLGAHRHA